MRTEKKTSLDTKQKSTLNIRKSIKLSDQYTTEREMAEDGESYAGIKCHKHKEGVQRRLTCLDYHVRNGCLLIQRFFMSRSRRVLT